MLKISNRWRWGISIGLLLILLLGVQHYIGWVRLFEPWGEVDPRLLALAAGLVLFSYVLRAVRLYDAFRREMRGAFSTAVKLMLQHNLANNMLPMRSGEASFPLLMSHYFQIPLSRSLPALLWFRVFDMHILGLLFFLVVPAQWLPVSLHVLLLMLWLLVPVVMYALNHGLLRKLDPNSTHRLTAILVKLLKGAPDNIALLVRIWIWSLLNWTVKLLAFAWLLALFADLSAAAALSGTIGGELTSVLPVHGVAGAGTYEAGIVAALLPFGVDPKTALPAAVNVHLFLLGVTLLGAALSLLLRSKRGV